MDEIKQLQTSFKRIKYSQVKLNNHLKTVFKKFEYNKNHYSESK